MPIDTRLVAAGAFLLLASSLLFLRTDIPSGVSLFLTGVASAGSTVAAVRIGADWRLR